MPYRRAFGSCNTVYEFDEEDELDEDELDEEDLLRSCSMWISVTRIATTSFSYCG